MNAAKLVLTAALLAAALLVAGGLSASAVGDAGPARPAGAAGEQPTSAAGPPADQNPAGALDGTPEPPAPQQTPTPTACVPGQADYQFDITIGNVVAGATDIGNHCDDCVTTVALPFPVRLYEQTYNSVNLSSNGNAQFGSSDIAFSNACLPNAGMNYAIYPYWDDLLTASAGYGIFTAVQGSAPNRTFVIEWRAQYLYGGGAAHFNLLLHENSPDFEVIYGTVTQGNAGATVGVQRDTGSRYAQYACNGAGGAVVSGLQLNWRLVACGTPTPTPTVCPPAGTPGPWRTATPGPPARYRHGGASDGLFTYVYGGGSSTGAFRNDLWRWDPVTETWSQLANMPTGKQNIQGSYWNGRLYVPGGYAAGGVHITENAIYNIATNSWLLGGSLPGPRSPATAAYNNRIYLFGGNPGPSNQVFIYEIATNSWGAGANMPAAVTYGRAVTAGSYAYYAGGIPASGIATNAVSRYDFAANAWTAVAPLNTARSGQEMMTDGTHLFVVNGAPGTNYFTGLPPAETFEIYTIAMNAWAYGSPTVQTASSSAGGYAGNKLMIQGGVNGSTYYDLVQVAVQPGFCPTATPTPPGPTATPTGGPQYRLYLPAIFRNAVTP